MLMNFVLGFAVMALCLLLQALLFAAALRYYSRRGHLVGDASMWSTFSVISSVMLILVLGNLAQVAAWAGLFQLLGEFTDFGTAFYHSAVNFSTLGYGDIVMSEQHRLLGPMEAINGVLMIGASTAALMTSLRDALQRTFEARDDS